jgi:dihydropteroate synthase
MTRLQSTNHPIIMGILNLTPDSFSDGAQFKSSKEAIEHAISMVNEGADIIDIGGESTRPDAKRVSVEEQKARVIDVIAELNEKLPDYVPISIDTTRSSVAEAALDAGATIINDVSAGRDDPDIISLSADRKCPYILMHMQGEPQTMQVDPKYIDVVEEVCRFLLERAELVQSKGVKNDNIVIDPGIGFGKTKQHNLQIISNLNRLVDTGYPVLLGASRKRFMGSICAETDFSKLVGATCATTAIGVFAGVNLFRVHDVSANRQAADVAFEIKKI